ncbi:hypothetical protein JTB14_014008 [Gonioctena quinquepunctata]|nr:hypothetical protein JTB14_014008 [Gonioctena quinquepunctata]
MSPKNPILLSMKNELHGIERIGKIMKLMWVPSHIGIQDTRKRESERRRTHSDTKPTVSSNSTLNTHGYRELHEMHNPKRMAEQMKSV